MLVIDPRPSRPEDENGWVLRHLASIMGRAGCAMMIAQCALVLIAAAALSDFAIGGSATAPPILGSMASLWIVATIALVAAAVCLRTFARRLPSKIVSGRPMRPSSWLEYMIINLVVTLGAALFPAGAI